MSNCKVIYVGEGSMATNFYALTDKQIAKRRLLGKIKNYDIIPLEQLKEIVDKSDKVKIYRITDKIYDNEYIFNYIIKNNINMQKIIVNTDNMSFSTGKRNRLISVDELEHIFSDSRLNIEVNHTNKLILLALKSMHNIYWETGKVGEWENASKIVESEYNDFCEHIEDKYGIEKAHIISVRRKGVYEVEAEEEERKTLRKLRAQVNNGFDVHLSSSIDKDKPGHGSFIFNVEMGSRHYWKVDSNEYYILTLSGLMYPLRLIYNKGIELVFKRCNVKGIDEFKDEEKRNIRMRSLYGAIKNLHSKGINLEKITNSLLMHIVCTMCEASNDINLYSCDPQSISLVVRKTENLTVILNRLNKILDLLNAKHCFDAIFIEKQVGIPEGIMSWDIKNPMRLDLKHLSNIINVDNFVNGCDEQQVSELFDRLRQ